MTLSIRNRLLKSLPDVDLDALRPHLTRSELPRGTAIELPGEPVRFAHFIEDGYVSVLITVGEHTSEVGLIGREGMLGVPATLGSDISAYQAVTRERCEVSQIPVATLRSLMMQRPSTGAVILRFIQAGVAQIAHTAFANAQLTIPQRLARWLLMVHDRVEGDTIRITHEMLSGALGVRRAGVTTALHVLEGEKAIRSQPRALSILDRRKLEQRAAGAYGPAERAYQRLLGTPLSKVRQDDPPPFVAPRDASQLGR